MLRVAKNFRLADHASDAFRFFASQTPLRMTNVAFWSVIPAPVLALRAARFASA